MLQGSRKLSCCQEGSEDVPLRRPIALRDDERISKEKLDDISDVFSDSVGGFDACLAVRSLEETVTQNESSDQSTLLMSAWHPPYERYSSMGAKTFLSPGARHICRHKAIAIYGAGSLSDLFTNSLTSQRGIPPVLCSS